MTQEQLNEFAKRMVGGTGLSEEQLEEKINDAFGGKSKPSLPSNLDEAAIQAANEMEIPTEHSQPESLTLVRRHIAFEMFKAGAEWMARQGVQDSIEGTICGRVHDHVNVKFPDWIGQTLEPKSVSHIPANVKNYNIGDAVIVQIRKKQ